MSKDRRAELLKQAALTRRYASLDDLDKRMALLEARVALLTKALAAKSFDLTIGFLLRKFDAELHGAAGRTERDKRLIREKLEHGNCFCFAKAPDEYKIVEADSNEEAWSTIRMTEGWAGDDVACLGDTKRGRGLYAA